MAFEIRKSGSSPEIAYTPDAAMDKARALSLYSSDVVITQGTGLDAKPWAFARYGKIYQRAACSPCSGSGKLYAGAMSPCSSCKGYGVTSGDEIPR